MQLQLNRMEAKLDELLVLKGIVGELTEAKRLERHKERARKAEVRQAARAERDATSLPLADNIFKGDSRLVPHFKKWALKGMEFGRNNQPEKLANYVCWQWNCATFLRKPITFSGGYFQYWIGSKSGRMHTTPFELMHLSKKSKMILRNDGEHADFRERKWWEWGYHVWMHVFKEMQRLPGYCDLPERFLRCCKLLAGGYGMYEVYTDLYFDPCEDLPQLNRMLRKVGPDLCSMWAACCRGLRRRDKDDTDVK